MSDIRSNERAEESVVPGSRVRSSLVWLGSRRKACDPAIEPLIRALRVNHPKAETSLVEKAYETAAREHSGQLRKSGEPFITHPVAVATILAEIGMQPLTLAAGLLHDTVEDTEYTLEDLTEDFGAEIALLVDGVTKLERLTYGKTAEAETVRKMIVAMSKDIRVLVIKLADRLHNARTWKYVPLTNAQRKARETLEIYAPLAHRLGMNTIKWELEDLSFKALYPKVYDEIERLVIERAPAREEYLNQVILYIEEDLRASKVKGTVSGRPKHHYSIYQKMIVRGREFDDIYDLVAVRVLVNTVKDCYAVLGAMHARWTPIDGRFKDYIAMPKFNLYQSLHTTVMGPGGRPVEIQIRTHEMHHRAEYGVAAHWKYKEDPSASKGAKPTVLDDDQEMAWLRQLVDWQRDTQDPGEFLDSLRYEMSGTQVYVFTPKGDVQTLPAGATPIDFAYAVHTEVGHRTVGARVNGRLVALDTKLDNGDTIEVFTSKAQKAGPSQDWLGFVSSQRARNKIKSWFSKERREEAIESGKDLIAKALRKQNLPLQRLMTHASINSLSSSMGYSGVEGLYLAVGESQVSASTVVSRLIESQGGGAGTEETLAEAITPSRAQRQQPQGTAGSGILVAGREDDDVWVKLAKCCTPVPGDEILGYVTRGSGISVHRQNCINVKPMLAEPERMIDVSWAEHQKAVFLVNIEIGALDREGLLGDISKVLTDYHVNIISAAVSTNQDRTAHAKFGFELADSSHLSAILGGLLRISGVYEAHRVTSDFDARSKKDRASKPTNSN